MFDDVLAIGVLLFCLKDAVILCVFIGLFCVENTNNKGLRRELLIPKKEVAIIP